MPQKLHEATHDFHGAEHERWIHRVLIGAMTHRPVHMIPVMLDRFHSFAPLLDTQARAALEHALYLAEYLKCVWVDLLMAAKRPDHAPITTLDGVAREWIPHGSIYVLQLQPEDQTRVDFFDAGVPVSSVPRNASVRGTRLHVCLRAPGI